MSTLLTDAHRTGRDARRPAGIRRATGGGLLEAGTRIGGYVAESRLGQGGMAEVWRVRDAAGGAWALKRLIVTKRDVRERFLLEARIQLSLDHPHIVRAHEVLDVDGDPALVMELVDGAPLDRWQLEHPQAPLAHKDRIARQLAEALAFAHGRGLVHRDLKPANVLVADRLGPWCKITDFGLAKLEGASASTRTGIALGTPRYMAPEQVRDAKRVDVRADVWSLGVVLYELYTGQPAFHRGNLLEVFTAVVRGQYVDPAQYNVPDRVRAAIVGALVVDPAQRFPDCGALLAALGPMPSMPPAVLGDTLPPSAVSRQERAPDPSPATMIGDLTPVTLAPVSDEASSPSVATLILPALALEPPPVARPVPVASPVARPAAGARPVAGITRRARRGRLQRTWILAWSGAMVVVVVGGIASLAVLGGLVTLRTLW